MDDAARSRSAWTPRSGPRALRLALAAMACLVALDSCGDRGARRTIDWVAACVVPRFDPDGPPDDVRWAIERMLSQGLTRERADGVIEGAAAERYEASAKGDTWTFHLRPGLRFTDGHACTSADFRAALVAGLARRDHSVPATVLSALRGARARAGRPKPALGIDTPDARTLVLHLDHPDSLLPLALSLPGISTPWRNRQAGEWSTAVGIGPYRITSSDHGARLVMARIGRGSGPDSVRVRFVIGIARLRAMLRAARTDVLWPVPPELLDQPVPPGYRLERSEAAPRRRLLLVMRADTPPTSHQEARRALAHGINRAEVLAALGSSGSVPAELVPGMGALEAPRYDATEVAAWMAKGDLGRSFQVTMLYDADRSGATVARAMQGTWSRQNLYVELEGLRGTEFSHQALEGRAQLVLTEWQPLERGVSPVALALVQTPQLGPCAPFRSGWRPSDAAALRASAAAARPTSGAALQAALERDLVVLPLADLPWVRLVREGGPPAPFHPHFGPDFALAAPAPAPASADGGPGSASASGH